MSVSAASPTVVSNRPSCSMAVRRTTAVGARTNEELRNSRRSASFGSSHRSCAERLLAPVHPVDVHDVDSEQQHVLAGCRPADRVEHGGARAWQQVVVVVELHDPLAGGDLHRGGSCSRSGSAPAGSRRTGTPRASRSGPVPRLSPVAPSSDPSDTATSMCSATGPTAPTTERSARSSRPGRLRVGIVIDSGEGCMSFTPWRRPGRYRPGMARSDRPVAGPAGSGPALVPPWAAPVAVVALVVGILLAGVGCTPAGPNPFDAWGDALAGTRPLPRRWGRGDRLRHLAAR